MNASEYQTEAARTLIRNEAVPAFPPRDVAVAWALVEMAEQVGAAADAVKKEVFHEHGYGPAEKRRTAFHMGNAHTIGEHVKQLLAGNDPGGHTADAADLMGFEIRLLWNTLGVLGEGAEIARVTLNALSQDGYDQAALKKEIGDLCWYLAALCTMLDLDLGDVLAANIAKLRARYPEGWDAAKSQQRDEAAEAAV